MELRSISQQLDLEHCIKCFLNGHCKHLICLMEESIATGHVESFMIKQTIPILILMQYIK